MIGWVQSLAFAAVAITFMALIAFTINDYLNRRQEIKLQELEHKQNLDKELLEEE